MSYKDIAKKLGVTVVQALAILFIEQRQTSPGRGKETFQFGLSTDFASTIDLKSKDDDLEESVVQKVAETFTTSTLLGQNCGKKSVAEIAAWLHRHGYTLRPD